ncbi:YpsA SLOG family protein [Elongatibacter sediminis]|uniref:Molybdenum carrier protein n=1 Tax=Elongatibacter sediminis TaxID=3119006 RepID=A0AAW9R7V9_9GAMM
MTLRRIVSGGQTGVDRGALDAALAAGAGCGGWCPAGRKAEDGDIPARYPLAEMGGGYAARTERNVVDSDATWILAPGPLHGGTGLTARLCTRHGRPCLVSDANRLTPEAAAREAAAFVREHRIAVLNVAGPRASHWGEGCTWAQTAVRVLLDELESSV